MRKMTAREFYEQGFLQELNRRFLHPLGMALEVRVGDAGEGISFGAVWDCRDEPEGMLFTKNDIGSPEFKEKALFVEEIASAKAQERKKLFGWVVQPVPLDVLNTLPHTMEEDFQHFLSYSGLGLELKNNPLVVDMLKKAFAAAWEKKQ